MVSKRSASKQYLAIVIDRPPGWQPRHALDMPLPMAEVATDDLGEVLMFAQTFNCEEFDASKSVGKWCLVVRAHVVT